MLKKTNDRGMHMEGKFDYRTKDWFILLLAFSGALKLLLASFGIELAQEQIDAVLNFVAIVVVIVGIARNKYVTNKEKKQVALLKQKGLK